MAAVYRGARGFGVAIRGFTLGGSFHARIAGPLIGSGADGSCAAARDVSSRVRTSVAQPITFRDDHVESAAPLTIRDAGTERHRRKAAAGAGVGSDYRQDRRHPAI